MTSGRPNHPDFWTMSYILIDTDKAAEIGTPIEDMIGRVIDPETLIYVAWQRSDRLVDQNMARIRELRLGALKEGFCPREGHVGLWIDAFMAGAAYQAAKDREVAE